MKNNGIIIILILSFFFSCRSYRSDVMFEVKSSENITQAFKEPTTNYIIKPNDHLNIDIFSSGGERLIDPDRLLIENQQQVREKEDPVYRVQENGHVDLPMIGSINLAGLNVFQAANVLENEYEKYYKDPYVLVRFLNKRVTVLGAMGGHSIYLENDQVHIAEILAMAGGLERDANASNIRLVRNDEVMLIDLTTIESYKKNNVVVEPGDIIYVEPVRRPVNEFFKENYSIVGFFSGIVSLIAIIVSVNN